MEGARPVERRSPRRSTDRYRCSGRCGLGSDGTDRLVMQVENQRGNGLYGAKITGGGSGGTVCVIGRAGKQVRGGEDL